MKVKEMIEVLKTMPQDAEMGLLWDGGVRSVVDGAYLAKSGTVVFGPEYEPAYYDDDRPEGSPTEEQDQFYRPIEALKKSSGLDI